MVSAAPSSSVAPESTVTAPVSAMALPPETASVPALTVVAPVRVLVPDRVRVPLPDLVRAPVPPTTPVRVAVLEAVMVAPKVPTVTRLAKLAPVPVIASVPLSSVTAAVLMLVESVTDRVPPVTLVVPV